MISGTNTIVTAIYELYYDERRGGERYKSFDLLTHTISNLVKFDYKFIIYTDNKTYGMYDFSKFIRENVEIRFEELNSEYYLNTINPRKNELFSIRDSYERCFSVNNYVEVIYNKIKWLLNEAKFSENVVWIDSGMFGTSCHDSWRDYLCNICYRDSTFLDKIFEKIEKFKFISFLGTSIQINYEISDWFSNSMGFGPKIVPGCLFGGKREEVIKNLEEFYQIQEKLLFDTQYIYSEQEILYACLKDKPCEFFEFGDWLDLQKAILKLIDQYDENSYKINRWV